MPGIFPADKDINVGYNWIDIQGGVGYVLFDGYGSDLSTGNDFFLAPSSIATSLAGGSTDGNLLSHTVASGVSGAMAKRGEVDFDASPLQIPQTVDGKMIVRTSTRIEIAGSVGDRTFYIIARFNKWDGSSETQLDSVQSDTFTYTDNINYNITVPITVDKERFKQGEQMRITIEYWSADSTGTHSIIPGHNPLDSTIGFGASGQSRMTVAIPFKINV